MLVKNDENIRVNTTPKSGRYYYKFDEKLGQEIQYPSVTTVIKFSDISEKKFKNSGTSPSAALGSLVHYKILREYAAMLGKRLDPPTDPVWRLTPQEVYGRINRCLMMWKELNLDIVPIEVETALFSEDPRYAGRLDLLAYIDGVYTLLDIKTGLEYPEHIEQAGAYWHALDHEPERFMYVYLDSIIDRNPSQKAVIRIHDKNELWEGLDLFKYRYANYISPIVI